MRKCWVWFDVAAILLVYRHTDTLGGGLRDSYSQGYLQLQNNCLWPHHHRQTPSTTVTCNWWRKFIKTLHCNVCVCLMVELSVSLCKDLIKRPRCSIRFESYIMEAKHCKLDRLRICKLVLLFGRVTWLKQNISNEYFKFWEVFSSFDWLVGVMVYSYSQ